MRSWTRHGKLGGYAFYGFLIGAFVADIRWKTTFQFFDCVVGLGMVNKGGYAFYSFLIRAFIAEIGRKTTFPFFECVVGLGMVN